MSHVTVYERVQFDAHGLPIKWEKSYDGENWAEVYWPVKQRLPFVLIRPIEAPCYVQIERWENVTNPARVDPLEEK